MSLSSFAGSATTMSTPSPSSRRALSGGQGVEVADDDVGPDAGREAARCPTVGGQHERRVRRPRGVWPAGGVSRVRRRWP